MDPDCSSLARVLAELDREAPSAPLLALGQTVFWDEPMKAGIASTLKQLDSSRTFIAGVHDTDYFAKFADHSNRSGFAALPHNDTTTKDLWSAAGEFSCLFGSETVVTREAITHAGGRLAAVESARPGFLEKMTEAWGWRGVVSLSKESKVTAEKEVSRMFPVLYDTFVWALEESLDMVSGHHHQDSQTMRDTLLAVICDANEPATRPTVADYYEALIRPMYNLVAGQAIDPETTRTTKLLNFNTSTAHLPRFEIVSTFLSPETRNLAEDAYNQALAGGEAYTLDRFGAGALPFDLYIPGKGRGTLRIGTKGGLVMTQDPVGFSYKKRPESAAELAAILEKKFGSGCVLVGKAVTLILMLAREFVFVFHTGASSYVTKSAEVARTLKADGVEFKLNPILRASYAPWDALEDCCAWLKLPEPLRRPYGTDELSAPSFARRWREVVAAQRQALQTLAQLRRPLDLVVDLQDRVGGPWKCLATEYQDMQSDLTRMSETISTIKAKKRSILAELKTLRPKREAAQQAKGIHWRDKFFDKEPTGLDLAERAKLSSDIETLDRQKFELRAELKALQTQQEEITSHPDMIHCRDRRAAIAFEAEMMRIRLIREAIIASDGLIRAGFRPAAWWFPLVCPDGTWFRATMARAQFTLEYLS